MASSIVSGSYQLSNGRQGSVRGTFTGNRLQLELVDASRGVVADIEGELDPQSETIDGSWQARELAAGRTTAGRWSARRLSDDEAFD